MNQKKQKLLKIVQAERKKIVLPGDKSISHRVLLFSFFLPKGKSVVVENLNTGEDVKRTIEIIRFFNFKILQEGSRIEIKRCSHDIINPGFYRFNCGNSGTTMRLLMGLLSGLKGCQFMLEGDASLSQRPMDDIQKPLEKMGAKISLRDGKFAPIYIIGEDLRGINYHLPKASAQVKSALILAALQVRSEEITVLEGALTGRDHTERLLIAFGAPIEFIFKKQIKEISDESMQVLCVKPLSGSNTTLPHFHSEIHIPDDISQASFWVSLFLFFKGQGINQVAPYIFEGVGLNPSRLGFIEVLRQMGANIEINIRNEVPEWMGDLIVYPSDLKAIVISKDIEKLIDEIPILSILMAQIQGKSSLHNARALRFKETDRLKAIVYNLKLFKVEISEFDDGFEIIGGNDFFDLNTLSQVNDFGDHRLIMSFQIFALLRGVRKGFSGSQLIFSVKSQELMNISDPFFYDNIKSFVSEYYL